MRKPRPYLAVLTSLLTILILAITVVWIVASPDSRTSLNALVLIFPAVFILGATSWWQWSIYTRKAQRYRRWVCIKRSLARVVLDMDSFEVTYETIPVELRLADLEVAWDSLQNLAYSMLKHQEYVETLPVASDLLGNELTEYESGIARLEDLAQGLMGSGAIWISGDTAQSVFDTLLRPITLLVREQLFYIEDIPGEYMEQEWATELRRAYGVLVSLADEGLTSGFPPHQQPNNMNPGSQALPRTQQEADLVTLRHHLVKWKEAEGAVYGAAQKIYRGLSAARNPEEVSYYPVPVPPQGASLLTLRKALGLPVDVKTSVEYMLQRSTALSYSYIRTDWRPKALWPAPRQKIGTFRLLKAQRDYARQLLTQPDTLKAHSILSRLDQIVTEATYTDSGAPRKALTVGIAGGIGLGLVTLWFFVSSINFVSSAHTALNLLLIVPTSFMLGFTILFIPCAMVALYLSWKKAVNRGALATIGLQSKRVKALRSQLETFMINLDGTRLNKLIIEHSQSAYSSLSQRLYERALALALRDVEELERNTGMGLALGYEDRLIEETSQLIAFLHEYNQDLEPADTSQSMRNS
ncbi:hypothetical protein [Rothia sp. P5766]|uniref:hypothetical protein n=1 Tax=Rothia sp. P5766 TaxID=3402656 RepID=UPI003AEC6797